MVTSSRLMRSWLFMGLTAIVALPIIGSDSKAHQTRPYDEQDRSTPRTTENADTDPQPYYVDGVQFKPYVSGKKKPNQKATDVTVAPAATQAPNSQLKPYVPATIPGSVTAQPQKSEAMNNELGGAQPAEKPKATNQSSSYAKASNSTSNSVAGPMKKRPRYGSAVIQSLDKVTAETVRFEVPVGKSVRYKGLIYTVKACETTADDEAQPDVIAYLQVRTSPIITPNMVDPPRPKEIFSGWSFASSPGINPIEHPIYDAWVIGCKNPIT